MISQEELEASYDKLYRYSGGVVAFSLKHKRPIEIPLYGSHLSRNKFYRDFIRDHVPPPSNILDFGCGRGFLMRDLEGMGYRVLGCDVAACLFEPGGPLRNKHAIFCDHGSLDHVFEKCQFDVVIANDVLEHLHGKENLKRTICSLLRLTRKWILFSVGCGRASRYSKIVGGKLERFGGLHLIRRGSGWWNSLFIQVIDPVYIFKGSGSFYFFGSKKDGCDDFRWSWLRG